MDYMLLFCVLATCAIVTGILGTEELLLNRMRRRVGFSPIPVWPLFATMIATATGAVAMLVEVCQLVS